MIRTAEQIPPPRAVGRARASLRAILAISALVALLLILWAWSRGLPGPYHFDDYVTPLNDPASQSLAAWREYLPATLRPVTKLTYALEAEAGLNGDPLVRRIVSIAMLLASAILLARLAARLLPHPGHPAATSLVAAFIALLWLAHPVHADSVLLISGRTALLSGLFLLAGLLALEHRRSWLAGSLFLLACLARETAIAGLLPLVVLTASRPGMPWRASVRELLPSLLAAVVAFVWILSTPRYLALAEFSFLGRPFSSSVSAQVGAVPVGLGLLLNPFGLSIDYGMPLPRSPSEPLFLLGAALYLAAAVGIVVAFRRSRAAAVGLALWLAALVPTQSVIPKLDPLTNRPLGLALLGLLLATTALSTAVVCWLRSTGSRTGQRAHRGLLQGALLSAAAFGAPALLLLLTALTLERGQLFRSEMSLWQDAADKSRTNARPHLQYALLLHNSGRYAEARNEFSEARRIDPFSSRTALLSRRYRDDEAMP